MQLDTNWQWDKRRLGCRIREETGNPAEDDLRERLAEITGLNLNELFSEMKNKKKKESKTKLVPDFEFNKTFDEVYNRTLVEGASKLAISELEENKQTHLSLFSTKNVNKRFFNLPKAPPKRVLMEIQRDRSKPLKVIDQDEEEYATSKLEKKLARQRAARMAVAEKAAKEEAAMKAAVEHLEKQGCMDKAFRAYDGDKFGTNGLYLEGMLYVSRMGSITDSSKLFQLGVREITHPTSTGGDGTTVVGSPGSGTKVPPTATAAAAAGENGDTTANMGAIVAAAGAGNAAATAGGSAGGASSGVLDSTQTAKLHSVEEGAGVADGTASTGAAAEKERSSTSEADSHAAKLYCASVLCNWSRNSGNAERLASEGAVKAMIQLSTIQVPHLLYFCGAAFRFMSEQPILAKKMIDDGAVSALADLISPRVDEFISANVAIALVNLTRVNGDEGRLVDTGVVMALASIISNRSDLSAACARGLYNLTCVDASYPLIERVIRALVQLAQTSTTGVKHICAASLCNLGDLKTVRPRMLEEGVISVLGNLAKGSETRTRRVCAVILQNLSATKACRVDMVARNSVQVAYSLSADHDPIILRCIGLTLSRLAHEAANCNRIISEGGITALCNIAVKYPTIPGISQPAALAFQLLSSFPEVRELVVQEGCVSAIASLLQSTDMYTLQQSLLALCHLLSEPENHIPIVQQGMIATLAALSNHDNDLLMDLCALAFLNFSSTEESRKHVVGAGAIVAIISLSRHKSLVTQRRCAAALCNVTSYEAGMQRMVGDGIIPALVNLVVSVDVETVRYACAAICRMCSTVENGKLILESGAIPNIVCGAKEGDFQTMTTCCAVLSSLSFYESCRVKLCEFGIISALKSLSELSDEDTKERCLVAFANLSCESSVQSMMIEDGVVGIISKLANSYHEMNQMCCAKALCNLSCCEGHRVTICEEGGMNALMMISMVRSVDIKTKLLCVYAMGNLTNDKTIDFVLSEGIVSSVANLSKLPDLQIVLLCAKLFNKLSYYPKGRELMVEKSGAMLAMFNIFDVGDENAKIIAARTTANMVLCDKVREKSIEYGALSYLDKGIQLEDEPASRQCIKAVFAASYSTAFRVRLANSSLPNTLAAVAVEDNGERYDFAMKILCNAAYDVESRKYLQNPSFIGVLFKLICNNLKPDAAAFAAMILCLMTYGYSNPFELISIGICRALKKLSEVDCGEGNSTVIRNVANTIRALCEASRDVIPEMATPETIAILKKACVVVPKEENVMYNIAATIFIFSQHSEQTRLQTATPDLLDIFDVVHHHPSGVSLIAASLAAYANDTNCRSVLAVMPICRMIVQLILQNLKNQDGALYNLVSTIYYLSKMPVCRDMMVDSGVEADNILLKLTLSDNIALKENCARALKNLSSDSNGTIEEGAVEALIKMSLEGKEKSATSAEDLKPPIEPQVLKTAVKPTCIDAFNNDPEQKKECSWYDLFILTKGGAAGKGAALPEPPQMIIDGSTEYPSMMEELDSGDSEGKTKMAFAKMQIPNDLRDKYLLEDKDFEVGNNNEKDVAEKNEEDAEVVEAKVEEEAETNSLASRKSSLANSRPGTRDRDRDSASGGDRTPNRSNNPSPRGGSSKTLKHTGSNLSNVSSTNSLPNISGPGASRNKSKHQKDFNSTEQAQASGLYA